VSAIAEDTVVAADLSNPSRFGSDSGDLGMSMTGQAGDDSLQEVLRGVRDLVDGAVERLLVALRWLSVAADLADELERCGADLLVAGDLIVVT
jgi:hypothetical protein